MEVDDEVWFDEFCDDSCNVRGGFEFPWDYHRKDFCLMVDKRKLDAIYQFLRGNAAFFDSIIPVAQRKKRYYSRISK